MSSLPFDFSSEFPTEGGEGAPVAEPKKSISVSEFNQILAASVESAFPIPVWVLGEVGSVKAAPSGHMYFTLKDDGASISCVIFRTNLTPKNRALFREGAKLRVRGVGSVYVQRGNLQLLADRVEPAGEGAQKEALERLTRKLQAEGIFAEERKRPLPRAAALIGVVTSETGAVIHDIARVAFRRGGARILLSPALVQGDRAAESMIRALELLAQVRGVEVIILGRGGGSAEDLSPFNDEALVRAIVACPIPVVSAVGHEVDVSLSDFAADARAATPSQAAEMLVPDRRAEVDRHSDLSRRIGRAMFTHIQRSEHRLGQMRFRDPRLVLHRAEQAFDDAVDRLTRQVETDARARRDRWTSLRTRLLVQDPKLVLEKQRARLAEDAQRLRSLVERRVAAERSQHAALCGQLQAMSPLNVLARGYAIVETKDHRAVRASKEVQPGEELSVRLADGTIEVRVAGDVRVGGGGPVPKRPSNAPKTAESQLSLLTPKKD